jgi:Type II secretion system (T2SS), protein G
MQRVLLIALFLFVAFNHWTVLANLGDGQARKLISRMAGAQLPSKAVRIKRISESGTDAEATAEIETAFRFVQDKDGHWQVAEVRMGQDRWEEISLLATASGRQIMVTDCRTADESVKRTSAVLNAKRARCLLAGLFATEQSAVRVKSVSDLGLPLASSPSSLVVALIETDVKFHNEQGKWKVSQLRTGNASWIDIDELTSRMKDEKTKRALIDMTTLAQALEKFHKDNGFYVSSDKHPVLVDFLSPRYLGRIIRLDPWGKPYQYQGERDHFQLRSYGPDGKENTPDDIVVKIPPGQAS